MIDSGLLAGRQVELIEGQILDMTPERPIHRATYRRGVKYLEALLGDRAVIFATVPIALDASEPQPDISIVMPPESRYDERHPQPEDIYWLIEVSNSTLAYDLAEKAQLYARNRIQEYWVIDIAGAQLWVHRQPEEGQYQAIQSFSTGKISPLSLQVEIEIKRLLS